MSDAGSVRTLKMHSTALTLASQELTTTVRVKEKVACAADVVSLTLGAADGAPLPPWEPGAHVDVMFDGLPPRQYSLSGDQTDRSSWRLGVLRDENGRGTSKYVHDELDVGDEFVVRGPRNNFPLRNSSRYVFIAGGIGITPILPMIRVAQRRGADWRLFYGGRHRRSMAFLDELAPYGARVAVRPQDEVGLLDLEEIMGRPTKDTLIYCCGPEPLLGAVEAASTRWPRHTLEIERFSSRPLTEPLRRETFQVQLARSGRTLDVAPDQSILRAVREAGVSVLSSCEEGTCGTCETPVLEGVPDHRDSILDEDERAANDCMMICISRCASSSLTLDL